MIRFRVCAIATVLVILSIIARQMEDYIAWIVDSTILIGDWDKTYR